MKPGWTVKTVSEIAKHSLGKMLDKNKNKGEPRPYLRNVNVRWFSFDLSDLRHMRFTEDETEKFTARKGDVLVCEGGFPGRAAIWTDVYPIYFQKAIHRVRFHEPERNKWFVYYLHWLEASGELRQYFTGTGIQHFTGQTLARLQVPLPPLAEQRRIVGILDEAFAGIARAVAATEKNLANARELFNQSFSDIIRRYDQSSWHETVVENLAAPAKGSIRTGPFGSQLLHGEFVDEGVAVLGIDNAVQNRFEWGRPRFITPAKFEQLARYQVHPGDVLITIMGTCGRCAVVPANVPLAINSKHLCCITPDAKKCLPEFLHKLFLYHPRSQEFLASRAKGSIMAGLNMGIIKELPVRLPPIQVQREIVQRFEAISNEIGRLESLYRRKLAALSELKQSILQKAFAGELTGKEAEEEAVA
jgi:type I restriction enzyme, S subunit